MKGKVRRRKYDAAFKGEVLQMVFNGRAVSEVARPLVHHLPLEEPPQNQRKQRGRASPCLTRLPGALQAHPRAGNRAGHLKISIQRQLCGIANTTYPS